MTTVLQTIADQIAEHINRQGASRSNWYVGITADVQQRLHGDHGVPSADYWFIVRKAPSAEHARSVEKSFLEWGCDGGPGGGDHRAVFVYAYLKSHITTP
jgi:hypothetical protein